MFSRTNAKLPLAVALLCLISLFAGAAPQLAAKRLAKGFRLPTYLCAAPGDTFRLFVLEKETGQVRIIK
ncbi:MAG: hypothetical protein IT367_06460, partial [Candidatus Hydrogenedentes bacterium]|nr:hypothetical protein [Candidatus Hydrogenedentota bacterium]